MNRLKLALLFFTIITPAISLAQNISATYTIERNVVVGSKTVTLNLQGYYYKKGNKYIYWERPLYLSKYPNGEITVVNGENNLTYYALNKDSIQMLFFHDYDSLITRQGLYNEYQRGITEYPFEADRSNEWIYEAKTKTINGLKCQLAINPGQWRVWFCVDMPTKTSLHSLQGLPGLVVEADCLPTNEHYSLINYDMSTPIKEGIFTPDAFKGHMDKGGLLKNISHQSKKTKAEKQQELLNQN